MKKIAVILMVLGYSLSVSGLSLQFKFCCGELKSVSCKTSTEKQCCGDDCDCTCLTIISSDQQDRSFKTGSAQFEKALPEQTYNSAQSFAVTVEKPDQNFSPPEPTSRLFLLYNVFRI